MSVVTYKNRYCRLSVQLLSKFYTVQYFYFLKIHWVLFIVTRVSSHSILAFYQHLFLNSISYTRSIISEAKFLFFLRFLQYL